MTDFTSSDGRIRIAYENKLAERIDIFSARGGENMLNGAPWLGRDEVSALREFFRHERDEANGVWRSQIDPTWTAVHEKGYPTVQFRNDDGMREFSIYPDRSNMHAWSRELQEIGMEYLDAHPEQKPWEDAKTGEVWLLTTADGRENAFILMSVRESGVVFESHDWRYLPSDSSIKAGRRIWPEDAS